MNKVILFFLLLVTSVSFGQHKPDWEKIKSLKIAFLTEKLALTTQEAQEFWPVYNDYDQKREKLREKERTQIRGKIRDAEQLSEKDARALLNQYLNFELEEEKLDEEFLKEVSQVISAKKTLLLLRSEEDFKRQLIKQYRENKGGR